MTKHYATYYFRADEQDPVIDIVRTCVEIFRGKYNFTEHRALREISKMSGVSISCMNAWFDGKTRMPRFCNIMAVVHATGREVRIGDDVVKGSKPRFHVVSNKAA
jgi:hypothetical protein